jgi:TatD DNase family protein
VLVDSHCHLGDRAFDEDRAEVVSRAWQAGLGRILVIGESRGATDIAFTLAENDPRISVAVGLHPHEASQWTPDVAAWLRTLAPRPAMVALGEIGLDYHYDHSPREQQWRAFDDQLALATELQLPAVIHAREADDDIAAMLRNHPDATVVMHSFSSGMELWRTAIELDHYISFSGMVTFRNWTLQDAVRNTPIDRLLVETDAPYLAPVPRRGKRNEPAYVRHVADQVAVLRGVTPEEIITRTGANASRLFGWPSLLTSPIVDYP